MSSKTPKSTISAEELFELQMELQNCKNELKLLHGGRDLAKQLSDMMAVNHEQADEIVLLQRKISVLNNQCKKIGEAAVRVESDRQSLVSELAVKEQQFQSALDTANSKLHQLQLDQKHLSDENACHTNKIKVLEALKEEQELTIESLNSIIANYKKQLLSMEATNKELTVKLDKTEFDLENSLKEKRNVEDSYTKQLKQLKERHFDELSSIQLEVSKAQTNLKLKEEKSVLEINKMKEELECKWIKRVEDLKEQHQCQITQLSLNHEQLVEDLSLDFKKKQEDFAHLQKHFEEDFNNEKIKSSQAIQELKIQLTDSKNDIHQVQSQNKKLSNDLMLSKSENDRLAKEMKELNVATKEMEGESQKCIDEMRQKYETTSQGLSSDIQNLQSKVKSLQEEYAIQIQKHKKIVQEMKVEATTTLRDEETKWKEKNAKLQAEFECMIDAHQKLKSMNKYTVKSLENEVGQLKKELESKQSINMEEMQHLQKSLDERSTQLNSIVAELKSMQDEKSELRVLIQELQTEMNDYVEQKNEAIGRTVYLEKQLKVSSEESRNLLEHERSLRSQMEQELDSVKRKLGEMNRQSLGVKELEKENMALKDKIVRQESFLKKKIHKERVLKERLNGVSRPTVDKFLLPPGAKPSTPVANNNSKTKGHQRRTSFDSQSSQVSGMSSMFEYYESIEGL